jgi:cytoskeletal protein CcmA (bactofilin family)
MSYRRLLVVVIVIFLALVPTTAFAAERREGVHVVIGPNEVVNDNVYLVGGMVDVEGVVRGDVIAVGASVNVPGVVTGDLIAPGGVVSISGHVGGAVRAAGATTTITGTVGEDVQAGGRSVFVGPSASIAQNLLIVGNSATVNGRIGGSLRAYANDLTIGGPVGDNVRANVSTLRLTSNAAIKGDVIYTSDREATIAPGATIKGKIERRSPGGLAMTSDPLIRVAQIALTWPGTQVGIYILGLAFVLLFPEFARQTIGTITRSTLACVALGFAVLVDVPILALILFIVGLSIGGWWLGLILLALYGAAIPLASVIASLFVGFWIFAYSGRSAVHLAVVLLMGLFVLTLLDLLPMIGGLITFVSLLFGLGALFLTIIRVRRAAH